MSTPAPQLRQQAWDDPYRPPRHPFRWLGVVLALAFLYVVSVGPAAALNERGVIPRAFMDAAYKPLTSLAEASRPAKRLLWWYLDLWISARPNTQTGFSP